MKKYNSFFNFLFIIFAALVVVGCVHDDEYADPNLNGYQCKSASDFENGANGYTKWTLGDIKGKPQNVVFTDKAYIEGYVSSSDESGNIYKTIYIQDDPVNPTHGFTLSVDAISTYTKYPQGAKVYIDVEGLALGTYGGLKQLGAMSNGVFGRIPEKEMAKHIFRSCTEYAVIVPKVMTLADMSSNDDLLGALLKIENAEFDTRALCNVFAPDGVSVDRQINDPTMSATSRVVRNSGFASFANQMIPAGKGDFVGVFSKFNSTYQMYINKISDLNMVNFPRKDGLTANPCSIDITSLQPKTVAEVKQMFSGSLTQINGNYVLKAKVTANDEAGNLFKYFYVEDATGGIRVNIDKSDLFRDERFKVGKEVYIKLDQLHVGNVNGELQLGQPLNGSVGRINEADIYKHFFDSNLPATAVIPTERTISQLTNDDVGKWIKIKDLQFASTDIGLRFADGGTTNRTLLDCNGNEILLRTSSYADFAKEKLDTGKGDVYAILSVFNGTYQLWIPKQINADLDNPRCDGSILNKQIVFADYIDNLNNWTPVSVVGTQAWTLQSSNGNGSPSVGMNGFAGGNNANEDWLVSKPISLANAVNPELLFETDVRFTGGAPLQVMLTTNYTGNPATTTWTTLSAAFDTNTGNNTWTTSGFVNLSAYQGQNVVVAFKYTSTTTGSNFWLVDNVRIVAN